MHFQKVPIPHLTRNRNSFTNTISLHVVLTNLVNTNFVQHDIFQEPKLALTRELVYRISNLLEFEKRKLFEAMCIIFQFLVNLKNP
jgi:hypothetical protein